MYCFAVGISHKTAPIGIREKFYLSIPQRELFLSELKNNPAVFEAIVLSTCNRTEIFASILDNNPRMLLDLLFKIKGLAFDPGLERYFYTYQNEEVVQHFLRVSTGLDSLILGEKQILGQIKTAVELSRKRGIIGRHFNILSNIAIRAGKKARTETQIDCGGSSVSWAAVSMTQKTLGTLQGKSLLIIGAGKMGHLAVEQLRSRGAGRIYIMNRTLESAKILADQHNGIAIPFWEIRNVLRQVDACICSLSCPHYIVEKDLVKEVMRERKNKALLFIDISMPRNIDPEVSSLANVTLVTIDELDKVVEENTKKRYGAVEQVEEIIAQKVAAFYKKISQVSLKGQDEFAHPLRQQTVH